MKASEVRLMVTITAPQHGCRMLKKNAKEAVLNGDIGDEFFYFCPPNWWPYLGPQGF